MFLNDRDSSSNEEMYITLSKDRYLGWMFPKVNKTIANLCFLTCVPRGLQSSSLSKKAII